MNSAFKLHLFVFDLLTHEGSHIEVYRDYKASLIPSAGTVPRVDLTTGSVRASPAYNASQILTLHQHRVINDRAYFPHLSILETRSIATISPEYKIQLINLEMPVLVRSRKSSNIELG